MAGNGQAPKSSDRLTTSADQRLANKLQPTSGDACQEHEPVLYDCNEICHLREVNRDDFVLGSCSG